MDRHVAAVIHDIGDGRIIGYYDNGRPEVAARCADPGAGLLVGVAPERSDEALLGTDNFDFLLEGVPNLVANQEAERYLPDYHAESDTYDKVDFREARMNAAIAAVTVSGIANSPSRLGPRQSRADINKVLEKSGVADQMRTWECGRNGRAGSAGERIEGFVDYDWRIRPGANPSIQSPIVMIKDC